MKWLRGVSLQRRLTLASILPVLLLGLLATLLSIYALQRTALDLILQRNTALVQLAASAVARDLTGYLRPLDALAGELAQADGDPIRQAALIHENAPFLDVFRGGVLLLDREGIAIGSSAGYEARLGRDYSFRDYFVQARSSLRPVFSAVLQATPTGEDAVALAVPLADAGGFSGALVGVFLLDQLPWAEDLAPLSTPQGGQVSLVDAAGIFIYHPDPSWLGRSVAERPSLAAVTATGQPHSALVLSSRGQQMVVSHAPLPEIGWGLIMEEPWHAVIAPALFYPWAVAALLAAGMALSVWLLVVSTRRAIRPLAALVDAAQRVTAGADFEPVEVAGPPEFRTLLVAFNQMVIRLAEQQAALRRYALRVLQSQEAERRRISLDLHDETVQDLVGVMQRVELCRLALERSPELARERLAELDGLVKQALAEVRRMSNALRPFILEDLGLPTALRALCEELDVPADVQCEVLGAERRLPDEMELTVFRIVQEALNNVRKHARSATVVGVTLDYRPDSVAAIVCDNGPGFAPPDLAELVRVGHLGLAGMVERAQLFDGSLQLVSEPGVGTRVELVLPG